MECRLLALLISLWAAPICAQQFPAPTLPLAGTEVIPCIQPAPGTPGSGYKGCTAANIANTQGGGALLKSNNLSDVVSASTALGNIGGASLASPNVFGSLQTFNLGYEIPASHAVGTYPDNWFTDSGATWLTNNDRAGFGAGTAYNGSSNTFGDWLSNLTGAAYHAAQVAQVLCETTNGLDCLVGASESLHAQATGTPITGGSFFGVLNNTSFGNAGWGIYSECRFYSLLANTSCSGIESDAVNLSGTDSSEPDPFAPFPAHYSFALQLACGGGYDGTSGVPNFGVTANTCTTAANISANGSQFAQGLVFDNGSLVMTNGAASAITMPNHYAIGWFTGTTQIGNFIWSTATTNTVGSVIDMQDGQTTFENFAGAPSILLSTPASAVNVLELSGAATGNPVGLTATGSDTNIGIRLNTKGTGTLNINGTNAVSCPANTVSLTTLVITDGLVTHC